MYVCLYVCIAPLKQHPDACDMSDTATLQDRKPSCPVPYFPARPCHVDGLVLGHRRSTVDK